MGHIYEGWEYDSPDHVQFIEDLAEAGLEPYHYRGRWYWEGPAVDVDDLQDALGATKVRCQWDHMGRGFVVYPQARGESRRIEEEADDDEELS